jgi:hypothetical protein
MKMAGSQTKAWSPGVRRRVARVNFLPLAERRRYVADMVDHAVRKGVKFDKPALGVTP